MVPRHTYRAAKPLHLLTELAQSLSYMQYLFASSKMLSTTRELA